MKYEAIVQNGRVSAEEIKTLRTGQFSLAKSEQTIELFVDHGWLQEVSRNLYCFGVRLYADLRLDLERDERVPKCLICSEICFNNVRCKSICSAHFHDKCVMPILQHRDKSEWKCFHCSNPWL